MDKVAYKIDDKKFIGLGDGKVVSLYGEVRDTIIEEKVSGHSPNNSKS